MSAGRGSGVSPWLAGLVGLLAYRSGRRRREQDAVGPGLGGPALRQIRLPDGRDALQVEATLFARDEGDTGTWHRVAVEGTLASQDELELTLREVAPGARTASDVPVVLMPVSGSRGLVAVDVYATGGRVGNLPDRAVLAVGDALLATHRTLDRPCAVLARITPDARGLLLVEVLLPDTFAADDITG